MGKLRLSLGGSCLRENLDSRLDQGVRNLLLNCAECEPGQRVLLVHETENDGYYEPELKQEIEKIAQRIGLRTETIGVPVARDVIDPDSELASKMHEADCTVFLARLGDQIRFRTRDAAMNQIISYALDRDMLASSFGTVDYGAFVKLKDLINKALVAAQEVHVTCPAGTDFKGGGIAFAQDGGDVTRKRFPLSVFTPVPASTFAGRVAQKGFLTGTGSNYYTPWSREIEDTLFIDFESSRIVGFAGSEKDVVAAKAHYEFVGRKYDIDTYFVHSWHAGIHPGCAYNVAAGQHFERWSGGAFGNPRLLHFHTCGEYPPGEISLNVLDPTVRLDGVAVWDNGHLHPERIAGGAALLAAYPEMAEAFENPSANVGQAPCGNLRFR